jgi:hypothetical protein
MARQNSIAAYLLAAALGFAAIAPATAHAAAGRCDTEDGPESLGPGIFDVQEFSVQDTGRGSHLITVQVNAAMPQGDAQKFVDRPGDEAIFRLWGDDPESDDQLSEFRPDMYWANPAGLTMRGGAEVSNHELNEDAFPDPSYGDELYVGIRLTDIRNGDEHKVETCLMSFEF